MTPVHQCPPETWERAAAQLWRRHVQSFVCLDFFVWRLGFVSLIYPDMPPDYCHFDKENDDNPPKCVGLVALCCCIFSQRICPCSRHPNCVVSPGTCLGTTDPPLSSSGLQSRFHHWSRHTGRPERWLLKKATLVLQKTGRCPKWKAKNMICQLKIQINVKSHIPYGFFASNLTANLWATSHPGPEQSNFGSAKDTALAQPGPHLINEYIV